MTQQWVVVTTTEVVVQAQTAGEALEAAQGQQGTSEVVEVVCTALGLPEDDEEQRP